VRKIADALRGAGVEVWFDQSELVGGDAWDQKIREQIKACALFIPVISAETQARREGYFRREWKQAAARTHDMADGTPFLLPAVIDATRDAEALVPEEFRAVQWTRLRPAMRDYGGQALDDAGVAAFCARVKALLGGAGPVVDRAPGQPPSPRLRRPGRPGLQPSRPPSRRWLIPAIATLAAAIALAIWIPSRRAAPSAPTDSKLQTRNSKSIAVLPFANLSPDEANAFFADGMHEELLTALAKIRDLKVISRTSVLAYRDPAKRNLRQIATELGVAHVLEGSVRRAGNEVRITVQLIDAATDVHRWADNYTGALTDVF
jgi:TolB-like protein